MLQIPVPHRRRTHDQRAIGDRLAHAAVLLCFSQHVPGIHRGTRLAKRHFVGIHDTQPAKAEVAHGASRGADVERIARIHQHDAQPV